MNCGIRLTPSENSVAVILDDGDFVYETDRPAPESYSGLLQTLAETVSEACSGQETDRAVGICIQGHEQPADGLVKSLHHPLIDGQPLRRDLQAVFNRPVIVGSEGQCLASAARQQPRLADKATIFALSLGRFVCGGIITGDRILRGPHGLAGDWGHLSLPWPVDYELDGRECLCGKTGCLEHFVSLPGLAHDYEMLTGSGLSADDIISQAIKGDIVAESALQVIEDRIARGLAMVIGLLDPDVIVVGGVLAEQQRLFTNIPRKWPGYIRTSQAGDILQPVCTDKQSAHSQYLNGAAHLNKFI